MTERHTIQKDMIYAALRELGNHPTADMVCERVRKTHPSISKATVYRVLGHLAEQGTIQRLPMPDGADRYDHRTDAHYHVYCEVCGRVEDVRMSAPGDLRSTVTDSRGFELTDQVIMFRGRCPDCRK